MGNSQTKIDKNQSVLKNNFKWKKQASLGYCDLVRDAVSGIIAEKYIAYVDQYSKELDIYQFRKDHPTYIVGVFSIEQMDSEYLCASEGTLGVVTERIPYRLSDLGQIAFSQGIYIIERCLKGADLIFRKQGSFQLQENMVCFNVHGEAKIWFNQNISVNTPQRVSSTTMPQLIKQIMELIEKRMSGTKLASYQQKKLQYNLLSFKNSFEFLNDMKKEIQTVNSVVLPSMIAESLKPEPIPKIRIKNEDQTTRREEQTARKLPKGLPPRPPKSRSKSRGKHRIEEKEKLSLQKIKSSQENKKQRLLSPQFDKGNAKHLSVSDVNEGNRVMIQIPSQVARKDPISVQKESPKILFKKPTEVKQIKEMVEKNENSTKNSEKKEERMSYLPIQKQKPFVNFTSKTSQKARNEKVLPDILRNNFINEPKQKPKEKPIQIMNPSTKIKFTFNNRISE